MPRKKKDAIHFNAQVDSGIMNRFIRYCDEVGQTRTLALERILDAFLTEYEAGKQPAGTLKSDREDPESV